jgi:hypothetical protein
LKKRFIEAGSIPPSLWCPQAENIHLPAKLVELWVELLEQNNLLGLSKQIAPQGFEGGISKEDTDKHLAWRYNGSCARVLLSMLDPKHELADVSDTYASIFAGNKVFLADLPSGSGAALVSILCALYELRANNVLPRHPLKIVIVAGEISQTARDYTFKQLESMKSYLVDQAIAIEFEILKWDALSRISTVDLIKRLTIKSQDCDAKLLILSNFSGFLESAGKWKEARPQFDDIFLHSRDSLSAVIWIEPKKNNVISLFGKVIKLIESSFKTLLGKKSPDEDSSCYANSEAKCKHPIIEGDFVVRLTVMRFDLPVEMQ